MVTPTPHGSTAAPAAPSDEVLVMVTVTLVTVVDVTVEGLGPRMPTAVRSRRVHQLVDVTVVPSW